MSESAARRRSGGWGLAAIAVGLAFVVFVIPQGFALGAVATWLVASAGGLAVLVVARAVRRRRGK